MSAFKTQLKIAYLPFISLLGFGILILGVRQFPTFPNKLDFLLILFLAAISQLIGSTTSFKKVQAYEVRSAVGIASNEVGSTFTVKFPR